MALDPTAAYTATLDTSKGEMTLELFASEAPVAVNNFVFLAREGFYNGLTFHRVIRGFMIQGGDPKGDGTGGPGYQFQDERVTRRYTRGVLAMANSGPNTNGSQFFIVHADYDLQPRYTIFGRVTAGLETLDRLADTSVTANPRDPRREASVPTETLSIRSIKITETKPRQRTP
jgi:cyclophilin family peptidyl-prolyl cis-trans isomerase